MKLSLTAWSFPLCTLGECAGIAKALGIGALDVGLFYRSALDKRRLLAEPDRLADELRRHDIAFANYYHLFGEGLVDRNLADPTARAANEADFRSVVAFCRAAAIPSVFVLPGVCAKGVGRERALEHAATALRALQPMAADAGVMLTVEPHVQSFLESPALTLELIERVPGLKLALDYAHFTCLGWPQDAIDPLAPHAGHVHLRQARPGALQCKLEHGTLNFVAMVETLRAAGYAGHLAIEYVHQAYMDTLHDDVLSETVKMRDLVAPLIA